MTATIEVRSKLVGSQAKRISTHWILVLTPLICCLPQSAWSQWRDAPEKWSAPVKINDVYEPGQYFGSACLTGDELTMYLLISDTICVSHRQNSSWTPPVALDSPINVVGVLGGDPSVTDDGRTMYFRRYVGSWRMFETHWNDSLNSWQEPTDMGDSINLYGCWFAMTPDQKHLFFHMSSLPWECTWDDSLKEWRSRQWVDYWKTLNCLHGLCVSSNLLKLYYDSFNGEEIALFVHYYDTIAQAWSQPMLLNLHTMLDTSSNPNDRLQAFPWLSRDMRRLYFLSRHDGTTSLWMSRMIVDENGDSIAASVASGSLVPRRVQLNQNYPNPFNPKTVVSGQWAVESRVRLEVFDILGRKVATLADGRYPAGRYSFDFDGKNLAGGVYFCRLSAGSFTAVRKMLLIR